jgi:hypothetical protein
VNSRDRVLAAFNHEERPVTKKTSKQEEWSGMTWRYSRNFGQQ